jgi:hypothetical protein
LFRTVLYPNNADLEKRGRVTCEEQAKNAHLEFPSTLLHSLLRINWRVLRISFLFFLLFACFVVDLFTMY